MTKREIQQIGGLIPNFSLDSLLANKLVTAIEKKIGHLSVSHIHLDITDDKGKDIDNVLLIYRTKKERKENTATLLCDRPETFNELVSIIEKLE